jgi:hypothetical protein
MNTIRKDFLEQYGYTPDDFELLDLYRCGELILTDKQENELIKYFNL